MKTFAKDLKTIYTAANEESARKQLEAVTRKWSGQYPSAMNRWNDNWDAISPIFKFSKEVRTAFYTTNAIESLNSCYRRLNKQRSVFPSSQALMNTILRNFWDSKKMDNANPELGQSTWWTGNHVPGSVNIAMKVGRSRVNIRPDFSGRSWHTNLNLLLNKQWLNHRNLLLSRINYHRRSEFTKKISHRHRWCRLITVKAIGFLYPNILDTLSYIFAGSSRRIKTSMLMHWQR